MGRKFKIGDKVIYTIGKEKLEGIVKDFDCKVYLIKFKNPKDYMHTGAGIGATKYVSDKNDCFWCPEKYLELDVSKYCTFFTTDRNEIRLELRDDDEAVRSNYLKITTVKVDKTNEIIGGKEMEEILEIYKNRKILRIEKEYEESIVKIEQEDALRKEVEEFKKEIEEKYKIVEIDFDYNYTEETKEKENIEYERMLKEKAKINNLVKEVEAQLSLCETYDQKINVLVNYNILDKKTKKITV